MKAEGRRKKNFALKKKRRGNKKWKKRNRRMNCMLELEKLDRPNIRLLATNSDMLEARDW
jgi:hypothetical protein